VCQRKPQLATSAHQLLAEPAADHDLEPAAVELFTRHESRHGVHMLIFLFKRFAMQAARPAFARAFSRGSTLRENRLPRPADRTKT
jgi:hypothetical protein